MSMPVIVMSNVSRSQAISDIIVSVALEQTGLAHIINAEGEKIQRVVTVGNVEEILAVNHSVQRMINAISQLEMVLQSKLELFSCLICSEE